MNIIKSVYNFENAQWNIDTESSHGGNFVELHFNFVSNNPVTKLFPDFKFGYSLYRGDELISSGQYPQNNGKFEVADAYPLAIERVWLAAEYQHKLYVWTNYLSFAHELTKDFTAPRPPQPFPSWKWVEGFWTAPIPKPKNGPYDWDEAKQEWIPQFSPDSVYAKSPMYGNEEFVPELGKVIKTLNDENHRPSPLGSPGTTITNENDPIKPEIGRI